MEKLNSFKGFVFLGMKWELADVLVFRCFAFLLCSHSDQSYFKRLHMMSVITLHQFSK